MLENKLPSLQGKVSILASSFQPVLLRNGVVCSLELKPVANVAVSVCRGKRQDHWFCPCLVLEEGNSCRPGDAATVAAAAAVRT